MFFKGTMQVSDSSRLLYTKMGKVSQTIREDELHLHGLTLESAKATMTSFVVDNVRYFQPASTI